MTNEKQPEWLWGIHNINEPQLYIDEHEWNDVDLWHLPQGGFQIDVSPDIDYFEEIGWVFFWYSVMEQFEKYMIEIKCPIEIKTPIPDVVVSSSEKDDMYRIYAANLMEMYYKIRKKIRNICS